MGGDLRFIIPETGFMYISGKAMDCFASLAMTGRTRNDGKEWEWWEGVGMVGGGGNGGGSGNGGRGWEWWREAGMA